MCMLHSKEYGVFLASDIILIDMRNFFVFSLIFSSLANFAQQTMTFEELDSALLAKPKRTVIFLHTDWCKYCQSIKTTSFKNEELISTLNEEFYFVMFNGEEKETVSFQNKSYSYIPRGATSGSHELAFEIGQIDGKLLFPTIVILDTNLTVLYKRASFHSASELLKVIDQF